jgi:hypothetical protein
VHRDLVVPDAQVPALRRVVCCTLHRTVVA